MMKYHKLKKKRQTRRNHNMLTESKAINIQRAPISQYKRLNRKAWKESEQTKHQKHCKYPLNIKKKFFSCIGQGIYKLK